MEETTILEEENQDSIPQTWAVRMKHVGMVSDLVARGIAKNRSEAARMLIEAGYEKLQAVTEPR